ncbi:DUF1127 domain-containing protein [Phyllobacterium sp. OV277]|uniref:DUF1127 domain-containing protein n=1 Tax=Phyllobacterium sp. OV277 TaxID=1882772 RepID=UPI00088C604C|nr:DUF1127 domain-containing protein [Phyllobacterium sp. OV277]SDN87054.1 protein of unknown function [Phyllobacterium sp. OV277]
MSNFETTGLLVNEPNTIRLQKSGDAVLQLIRKVLTFRWNNLFYRAERADDPRISKLSDHLLDDIGITRQQAEEIDRRSK